jgi:hypothetical protein
VKKLKLNEILDEVNRDLDESLELGEVIGWVNRCLDDLTPIAKKESLLVTDTNTLNSYDLPDDLHEIGFVVANDTEYERIAFNDNENKGFKTWANTLFLQPAATDGSLQLYYYKKLAHVSGSVDIPEIEEQFHDLFVLYTVAYNQFMEEEPQKQADALNRYAIRKREFADYVRKTRDYRQAQIKNVYSTYWG